MADEKVAVGKELIEELISAYRSNLGFSRFRDALIQLESIVGGPVLKEWTNHESLEEMEEEEIGRLIKSGMTSGILDHEDGERIAWELNWNKWKEE